MRWTRWAMVYILLQALWRALTLLASLVVLFILFTVLLTGRRHPVAVTEGSGDPGAESDSPEPYMTFDLFWELPAQGPNASEAFPADLKNETGLGNTSWPSMERSELMALLEETLPGMESKLVDEEAPEEGQQALPDPEENSEALQPTGVAKRFSSAEDTKTDPDTVEGVANAGTDDPEIIWSILGRIFLAGLLYAMMVLLVVKVAPAWTMDIKERFAALRAGSELLCSERGNKEFMV